MSPDPARGRVAPENSVGRFLDRFGLVLCLLWGVAKAAFFLTIPEMAVGAVALFNPR